MIKRPPAPARLEVLFSRQIDLAASLSPLGRAGDDLIDRWDGRTLVRAIRPAPGSPPVAFMAQVDEPLSERLRIHVQPGVDRAAVLNAVGATLLTDDAALRALATADPAVASLTARHPGIAPILFRDPFTALVRSISAQQINLPWAARIRARLAERYGQRLEIGPTYVHVLDPERLAAASEADLRALQLTHAKARAVIATARAALAGELELAELEVLDDEAVIGHLTRLPGIGRWSAEWFLARTLGRPRVVAGDLGVRKAVGRLYAAGMPSEIEVRRLTEHWGAAAAHAQALALHDLAISPATPPGR